MTIIILETICWDIKWKKKLHFKLLPWFFYFKFIFTKKCFIVFNILKVTLVQVSYPRPYLISILWHFISVFFVEKAVATWPFFVFSPFSRLRFFTNKQAKVSKKFYFLNILKVVVSNKIALSQHKLVVLFWVYTIKAIGYNGNTRHEATWSYLHKGFAQASTLLCLKFLFEKVSNLLSTVPAA